jgi:membrane protease subunit (stomatin/prohibitin family)
MLFQAVVSEEKEAAAVAAAAAAGAGGMFTFDDPMGMFMGGAQENRFVTIRCAALQQVCGACASVLVSSADDKCAHLPLPLLTDSSCACAGCSAPAHQHPIMFFLLSSVQRLASR